MGEATSIGRILVLIGPDEVRDWVMQRLLRWGYVGIVGSRRSAAVPSLTDVDVVLCDQRERWRLRTAVALARRPGIPVVVLLPKRQPGGPGDRLPEGAFDYLPWPCTERDLQLVLARALRWYQLISSVPAAGRGRAVKRG